MTYSCTLKMWSLLLSSFHGGWCWAEHWMSYFSQQRGFDTYAVSLRFGLHVPRLVTYAPCSRTFFNIPYLPRLHPAKYGIINGKVHTRGVAR